MDTISKRVTLWCFLIHLLDIYAPNQEAPKHIKQILTELKGETDKNTIIVGDLNIPLTALDRLSKQKINKEISVLNDTLYQQT